MSTPVGRQSIRCNVASCTYNNREGDVCELRAIQVAAKPGGNTATPEDESMCASYKNG